MLARAPRPWIEPPGVHDALSGDQPVVAVVGPRGSGKSAALSAWAEGRSDVHRLVAGRVPDVTEGRLVVDDADALPGETWVRLGERLAEHPDLHLRIALRSLTSLPEGWDVDVAPDLYLPAEGIARLLTALGSVADPDLVRSVSAGHPATVRLIARSGSTTRRAMWSAIATGPPAAALDDAHRRLAVPQHLTWALAAELGAPEDFLLDAERDGLGRWVDQPDHRVFQLVSTVRHQARTRARLTVAERLDIRARAARHLLDEGAHLAAIAEAVGAQRNDLVAEALARGNLDLLMSAGDEIELLLRGVPIKEMARHPVTVMMFGVLLSHRRDRRARAADILQVAAAGVGSMVTGPRALPRRLMRVFEAILLRASNRGDGGVAAARSAAATMDVIRPDELGIAAPLRAEIHANLALVFLYGDDLEAGSVQVTHALGADPSRTAELLALGISAVLDMLSGRSFAMRETVRHVEGRTWPAGLLDSHVGCLFRVAQAYEAVERGDLDAAEAALDAVWGDIDLLEHWVLMLYVRALLDLARGRAEEGLERFREVRALRADRGWARGDRLRLLDVTESLLLRGVGDTAAAAERVAHPGTPRLALAAVRVALLAGDDQHAAALAAGVRASRPGDRMAVAAIEAILLARAGRAEEARHAADRALSLSAVHGARLSFRLLPAGELGVFGALADEIEPLLPPALHAVPVLTPREEVVLRALASPASIAEIAAQLHVSVNTVKSQTRTLYRKLGVSSREEAVLRGLSLRTPA